VTTHIHMANHQRSGDDNACQSEMTEDYNSLTKLF